MSVSVVELPGYLDSLQTYGYPLPNHVFLVVLPIVPEKGEVKVRPPAPVARAREEFDVAQKEVIYSRRGNSIDVLPAVDYVGVFYSLA